MRAGKRNSLDLYNDLLILVADCVKNSETQQLLILNMKYFLEILYSTNSEERKALISPEIKDEAYSKIMCVHDKILARSSSNRIGEKTTYSSDDKELLQYYAEFISFIGVGKSTSIKVWSRKGSEITASNSSSSNHEDIWDENLCVLDKDYIKINRNDHVEFCANVYKNLKDMIISIDCHPNNIFFSMWQLECLMLDNKYQNENHITFQVDEKRTHTVSKTIRKFARIEESKLDFTDENPFLNFCSYLISSISNVEYQSVFISLYTLILTENYAIIQQIVPYFVYFALRFCENDETIDNITEFMKGLLQHGTYHQRMTIFSIVDFINICLVQDKASVRNFLISNKTAYCEKLFQLKFEMDQVDFQNDTISKLIEKLGKSKIIKYSFRTVSKMMQLLDNIPLNELSEIALKCREYKRAAIFFEEHVRQNINPQLSLESMTNFIEYSIDSDKVWMLIETYSKILPNDINKKELKHFTEVNILKESKSSEFLNSKLKYQEYQDHSSEVNERDQDFLNCIDDSNNKYINNMLRRGIESYFKLEDEDMTIECSQIWKEINTYFSCIDLNTIDLSSLNIDFESSKSFNTLENLFIMLISLMAEKVYNEGSCKFDFDTVNQFILQMINYLNFNLADLLVNSHGDKANQYKLFLHIVYEIKFVYSKYFINYKNNKEEFKLDSKDKEYLIIMFKERTEEFCIFENNYKHLCLIYSIRSYIFLLFKCLYEYCYFQTRKVSILVQINKSNFEKLNLFRHLEILKELIPDFEFEKAKFHRLIGEKCKAKDYLKENLQEITERFEFYKEDNEIPKQILNKNLIHDIWYFLFEIMIEIDPSFPKIEEEFYKYFSNQKNPTSEKMFVLYAAYIDYLNMIDRRKEKIYLNKDSSTLKLRNCVTYYFKSINSGCSLLWHTLPKILEIWFQLKDHEKPLKDEIERELIKLDTFKIVQILQILLSRFSLIKYRDTIVKLVSKVAAKYPLQSAWWLSHFKHFYSHSKSKHIVSADKNNRDWFVTKIVEQSIKLCSSNEECKLMEDDSKCQQERKVYEFERIFNATSDLMNALIKFGNEEIPTNKK